MTLTVVIGSSGSGKTTFLNDVQKSHKCTYIRQEIYESEGTAESIKVGGTLAGEFTAGLSGGQRKLLLFDIICQRTASQSDLLIVLDEPFAGVTDDFVPFIQGKLEEIRQRHNILLVTNDHVEMLTTMADSTITVSAIDRSKVQVNKGSSYDREKAIVALSVGDQYKYKASSADFKFFIDTEVKNNAGLIGIAVFTAFSFLLFLVTFWDSSSDSAALVLVAGGIIAFFCVNPYLLGLVEWRNAMTEEAEALVHASKGMNKGLKTILTVFIIVIISLIEFGVVNAVIDGLESIEFWIAMLCDSVSLTFPLICLGLYSEMPFQAVQIIGSLPFLLMIFLSTTFSPGSGVPVLKALRYIYSRFYFWCMIPVVEDSMEGCPESRALNIISMILSSQVWTVLFFICLAMGKLRKQQDLAKANARKEELSDAEFGRLQDELFGAGKGTAKAGDESA